MKNYKIRVLSETKWLQSGQVRLSSGEQLLYSGHIKDGAPHTEGVALMLAPEAHVALNGWNLSTPASSQPSLPPRRKTLGWTSSSAMLPPMMQRKRRKMTSTNKAMWKLLRHYGVPEKIIFLLQCTYLDMSCRIAHTSQLSESFEVKTGVWQGCLLSPFLFLLVIDWIMKITTRGWNNGIQWTL